MQQLLQVQDYLAFVRERVQHRVHLLVDADVVLFDQQLILKMDIYSPSVERSV